ncbi:hypothetical protein EYV94_10855 [Puteibacter caeruleilacunae]|nr:hypothetical protein EYV94_10855 [Puteibacter caeruleilacunae]
MIKLLIALLIVGLFFIQKVGNHGGLLKHPYDRIYSVCMSLFDLIHKPMRKRIKPINVGRGLDLDIVPFITLFILLVIMIMVSKEVMY